MNAELAFAPASNPRPEISGESAAPAPKVGFTHDRDLENGKEEWLTPPQIIQALAMTLVDGHEVKYPFDLDPCAPTPETRPWDTATQHYSILNNGLTKPWVGRVWCNPPYGPKTGEWMARCAEHRNATALIFARTETQQFFKSIWPKAAAVCFIKGRLSFWEHECTVCGKGISTHRPRGIHNVAGEWHAAVKGKKAIQGGTAGAPSMVITWDDDNANALWTAVASKRLPGAFVDLRGGNTAP